MRATIACGAWQCYFQQCRVSRVPLTARRPRASMENARHSRSAACPPSGVGVAVAMKDWPSLATAMLKKYLFELLAVASPRPVGGAAEMSRGVDVVPQEVFLLGVLQFEQGDHGFGAMHAEHLLAIAGQRQRGDDADEDEHHQQLEQCDSASDHAIDINTNRSSSVMAKSGLSRYLIRWSSDGIRRRRRGPCIAAPPHPYFTRATGAY